MSADTITALTVYTTSAALFAASYYYLKGDK